VAIIRITDLNARAIIGTHAWERNNKQDIVINVTLDYDAARASASDRLADTIDYKVLTQKILKNVEQSQCLLLEKLASQVLGIVMSYKKVSAATVRIDKPHALPLARSVSVELSSGK